MALSKRSNELALSLKKELSEKLEEFVIPPILGRSFENREQIEISKFYERLPKPTTLPSGAPRRVPSRRWRRRSRRGRRGSLSSSHVLGLHPFEPMLTDAALCLASREAAAYKSATLARGLRRRSADFVWS